MPEIVLPEENHKIDLNANMSIPAWQVPSLRMHHAIQNEIDKNVIVRTRGGIGDCICAEPAIRWGINNFAGHRLSVLSPFPGLYQHLNLKEVINWQGAVHNLSDRFFVFDSLHDYESLANEFLTHHMTQCVDYSALALWRCQIPMKDKCIQLVPSDEDNQKMSAIIDVKRDIVVHPGRSWQSKTFPVEWWNSVLKEILNHGGRPVLVGGTPQDKMGTVDVDATNFLDLRGKNTIMQSVACCQMTRVTLCSDSSVLHMAASGSAYIGFISTVKHPETITHYRNGGEYGWRMQHFGLGGMYQIMKWRPADPDLVRFDLVDEDLLKSWLPDPKDFALWGVSKLGG